MTENVGRYFPVWAVWLFIIFVRYNGLFREANKPILADSIWTAGRGAEMPTQDEEDGVICHVLDGGSLIQ